MLRFVDTVWERRILRTVGFFSPQVIKKIAFIGFLDFSLGIFSLSFFAWRFSILETNLLRIMVSTARIMSPSFSYFFFILSFTFLFLFFFFFFFFFRYSSFLLRSFKAPTFSQPIISFHGIISKFFQIFSSLWLCLSKL